MVEAAELQTAGGRRASEGQYLHLPESFLFPQHRLLGDKRHGTGKRETRKGSEEES